MANDPQLNKRLKNVRGFELVLSLLTPEEREIAIKGSDEQLSQILIEKGIRDIPGVLIAKRDWLALKDYREPEETTEKKTVDKNRFAETLKDAAIGDGISYIPKKEPFEENDEPVTTDQPQANLQQTQNANQELVEPRPTTAEVLTPARTEIITPPAPSIPNNNEGSEKLKDNFAETAKRIDDLSVPSETVGYYPDAEIIPESYATETYVSPTPEPEIPQPVVQEIQPDPPRLSQSPRKAGLAARKRARISKGKIGKSLASGGKKAAARTAAATIEIWGPIVGVILAIFLFIVIVLIMGCSFVSNPIGDALGVNYCGNNPPPPPPPVVSQERASSVTFIGGEAYLSTADGCRVNCPAGSKGDRVTIKIIVEIDPSKLDQDPNNVKANLQISNRFFADIKTPGSNPQIIAVPVDTTYFVYQWKIPNPGESKKRYEYTITGVLQTDTGATNVILSMSGVTLTQDGSTSGEDGGLYQGATNRPTNNTCDKYGGTMRTIKQNFSSVENANYGDPLCTYTDAKLNKVIEQTEKNVANQNMWKSIAKCETISPNAYVPSSVGGSWGKFQMRRSFPNPFKPWTQADDRGDVPWQKQVENAVSYNNSLARDGKNFSYWGTARCLCYYDKFKNTSSCKDIIRRGEVRSPSGSCSACTASEGRS